MNIKVGDRYRNNVNGGLYEVVDITGDSKAIPSDGLLVHLDLIMTKTWIFNLRTQQQYITYPAKKLLTQFKKDV